MLPAIEPSRLARRAALSKREELRAVAQTYSGTRTIGYEIENYRQREDPVGAIPGADAEQRFSDGGFFLGVWGGEKSRLGYGPARGM